MLKNISVEAALEILLNLPLKPDTEKVSLSDCLGRVLSQDVYASINVPPFDRSPFDGYALRAADTHSASSLSPAVLTIIEEIPAGKEPEHELRPGQAAKILTGAPIPKGADTTIKYEETEFTETEVKINNPLTANENIVFAGEDIPVGTRLAARGTVISAGLMGIFAGQGLNEIGVYKKPTIAILNTGTELTEVGRPLMPAKIYNSNVYTLSAYLLEQGALPFNGGTVEDNPEAIALRIDELLKSSDMVITTGGASVGDYDWAVTAAERTGADILFWKTQMKPGGSIIAAEKGGKLILSLSGNPGAAVLGLFALGLPYIRSLCGRLDLYPEKIKVPLRNDFDKGSSLLRFLRGRLEIIDGTAFFCENEGQGSGAVASLKNCDLLGLIPAGSPPLKAGTLIEAYKLS